MADRMNSEILELEDLRNRVMLAFSANAYPGNDNIIDLRGEDDEEDEIYACLVGKHWKEVNVLEPYFSPTASRLAGRDFYSNHSSTLYLVTPLAYKFYLPAFLLSLLTLDEADSVGRMTLDMLAPPYSEQNDDYWKQRVSSLNSTEKQAVHDTLVYVKRRFRDLYFQRSDIAAKLDAYWFNDS